MGPLSRKVMVKVKYNLSMNGKLNECFASVYSKQG